MPRFPTTGTAARPLKAAVAVAVLALFASVVGFVTPTGSLPASAQDSGCGHVTLTVDGFSVSTHACPETDELVFHGEKPDDHVWCSSEFGTYFTGHIFNDPDVLEFHRTWIAIGILAGVVYVPEGCGERDSFNSACVILQDGQWRFSPDEPFVAVSNEDGLIRRTARGNGVCLDDYDVSATVEDSVREGVCNGTITSRYVEFFVYRVFENDLFTWDESPRTVIDVTDELVGDCCPRWDEHEHDTPHSDGAPNNGCHKHTRPPCQAGQAVTYDRIDGDSHSTATVAPCTASAGATFDIVLDYPRRGHGRFATIGGALAPVTFTATASNFVCHGPCGDPAAGSPHPVAVSYGLDLAGLNGYTEGHGNNFREISKTVTGNGRVLNLSINIVAEFYRATWTVPDQRVAINIVNPTGTYQYYEFEWVEYWIPVADHPDGGVWYPVKEVRARQASMTARIVDVDGDPITADPYYNNGRVELRIAGFQPVID